MDKFNTLIETLKKESAKTTQVSRTRCRKLLSSISKQCKHARSELLAERKQMKKNKVKKVKPVTPVEPPVSKKKTRKGK